MAFGKKFACRYGCGATFKSASGQRYHEHNAHGGLWTKNNKKSMNESPEKTETGQNIEKSENNQYVKITEVKYMVKKTAKPKEDEDVWECGKCGSEFNEKKKYCPECGCEFA